MPYLLRRFGPWWGKLAGFLLGFAIGRLPGALLGLLLGHQIDRRVRLRPFAPSRWGGRLSLTERHFLTALCAGMGHLAKSDGRVSEAEVAAAELVMDELGLVGEQRRHAIALFTRGKEGDLPLASLLQRLSLYGRNQPELLDRFLGYQLRIALADGPPAPAQRRLLVMMAHRLGVSSGRLEELLRRGDTRAAGPRPRARDAYRLLGVEERASDDEIKIAYRRCIGRHHPDRLAAQGLSEAEVREASRRTHEIRAAYEEIRRLRGF